MSPPDEDSADQPLSLDAPIALDPDVRTGTLPNGMRYFVRENTWPEDRAELRLVVDAGSVLEDDDQRGLAHALEHMAFRGTRKFPRNTIDEYLQSVGMRLGDDVNATTGFDETIYRLTIPAERTAALDTGVTILAEWAHAVTLDSAEARREAPVVFEEWRSRRDADGRVIEARDQILLGGSRYASRAVIGDTASLRRFDVAAMRRFYRDWYRPELMAVVAVGDFDAASVERLIRKRLGEIPKSAHPRSRPRHDVAIPSTIRTTVIADPEVTSTRIALWFARAARDQRTLRDYRAALVDRIGRAVLRSRLEADADRAGSALLSAGISLRRSVGTVETIALGGTVTDGRVPDGVATLTAAAARLARFGPTDAELAAAKDAILRERREALGGPGISSALADGLADYFLDGIASPGPIDAYRWTNELLSGVTAKEVAAVTRSLALDRNPLILVTVGTDRATGVPSDSLLLVAADSGGASVASDARDSSTTAVLMRDLPRPGAVTSRRMLTKIDAFEWVLANGMHVLLKPTRFTDEEVVIRVSAPGGASLADKAAYPSAYMSDKIVESMGVGSTDGYSLGHLLDDRSVSITPQVGNERVQLAASGRQRDMELMLQVMHLYFTAPREDAFAFKHYRDRLTTFVRDRMADPESEFADTVAATLWPGDLRALPTTAAFVSAIDMQQGLRFWRDRMANASNFTAVIVGDFEVWQVSPLIERYLASLPAGKVERPGDLGIPQVRGAVQRVIHRGIDPRAQTSITIADTIDWSPKSDADLNTVRDLVNLVLQARLREQLGGTYDVSVSMDVRSAPRAVVEMTIGFTAAPERIDTLASAALAGIERLRTKGPTADEAAKVKAAAIRHHDDGRNGNDYWANELAAHALLGWSLEFIAEHGDDAAEISTATLSVAAARYLDGRRYVRVTRMPASTQSTVRVPGDRR
jgi:zinc protease